MIDGMSEEKRQLASFYFQPKNEFWKARTRHGRKAKHTPEELMDVAFEYLQWNEDNPLYAAEPVKYNGDMTIHPIPKIRIATLMGFCQFLGIAHQTWYNYKAKEQYAETCEEIEKLLDRQKLEAAAAELCNGNLVARIMGLTDKQEQTQYVSGPGGKPIQSEWKITIVDPEEGDKDGK